MGDRDSDGGRQEKESSSSSSTFPKKGSAYGGFAEAISALEKLNRLESDIATMISACRIPIKEVRKFFRCTTPDQTSNVSLFQYMKALFMQLGIDLEISGIEPYCFSFSVKDSAVSDLYSGTQGRTCDLICEAISRFFERELKLGCVVKEVRCVNAGNEFCEFEAAIDREDFCRVALGDAEREILRALMKSGSGGGVQESVPKVTYEELEFRMALLKKWDLIDDREKVTELGANCASYVVEEDDIEPPWREMRDLS
ncbi:MAG: hypothetical protein JSV43_02155 [Methanobacteriota archaeon]|nr:MAG: hypothetical protein JSV43_02155 [Euryarchaeota archaeon]